MRNPHTLARVRVTRPSATAGLAMGDQICSPIPVRIIVAIGNLYSYISKCSCTKMYDYLLSRIRTDPPRRARQKFWKSVMSYVNLYVVSAASHIPIQIHLEFTEFIGFSTAA